MKKIRHFSMVMVMLLVYTKSFTQYGEICYQSPTIPNIVNARIQYTIDATAGTLKLRVIFSKKFVDNTYGTTSIGWGTKGHKFGDLVGSDHVELALYDKANVKKMDFKLDYITASNTVPSGYKSLGVLGGDGKMILGNAADVLSAKTAMDANFNDFGYVLTTNSPATDTSYTANSSAPNWIFDVWYETTVRLSALGTAGFGRVEIPSVHASPSKTGNNTEIVVICECPKVLRLGNLVFNDANGNGLKDLTESGIGNVSVKLYKDSNADNIPDGSAIASTTTNANGNYLFSGLAAGKYLVGITIPSGLTPTITTATSASPDNDVDNDNNGVTSVAGELRSNNITLAASTEPFNDGDDNNGNLTMDFGLRSQPAILNLGNLVWLDINANNLKDASEPVIPNAIVKLYNDANNDNVADGAAIGSTTTNSNGLYNFTGLAAGNYIVGVTIPANYQARINAGNDPDNNIDNDNNCVTLVGANQPGSEVRSLAITLQPLTEPTIDGDDSNGNLTLDFGLCPLVINNLTIGNLVWLDINANNLKDINEPVIPNAIVKLYNDANNDNIADGAAIGSTVTNSNGLYSFTGLAAGNYIVGVVIPANNQARLNGNIDPDNNIDNDNNAVNLVGANSPGNEVRSNAVTLLQGTEPINDGDDNNGNLSVDFGMCPLVPSVKLGNQIFIDMNGNGVQDLNEPGVPGTTVNLYNDTNGDNTADGPAIATTITGTDGTYNFSNLAPGSYLIGAVIPDGYGFIGAGNPLPNNDIDKDNNGVRQVGNEVQTNFITLAAGTEPTGDGDDNNSNLTLDVAFKLNVVCKSVNGKNIVIGSNGEIIKNSLSIYPNPAIRNFTLNINSEKKTTAIVSIVDQKGRRINSTKLEVTPGVNTFNMNANKTLTSGIYTVQSFIDGQIITKRLIIGN